jgi:hypothetical protein
LPRPSLSNLYGNAPVHDYLNVVPQTRGGTDEKEQRMEQKMRYLSSLAIPPMDAVQPADFYTATFGLG